MTNKFLFGTLAMALVLGMVFTGCDNADENGFENNTINLASAEEKNAILLTLKGATWKDPTLNLDDLESAAKQTELKEALLELLYWDQTDGVISSLSIKKSEIVSEFKLEKDNVVKITFSKMDAFGANIWGTGTVTLNNKDYSGEKLLGALELVTEEIDLTGVWTIGKNEKVTITIPK